MDVRRLRADFRNGRVSADWLLDALEEAYGRIGRLEAEMGRLTQRLAQYEPEVDKEQHGSPSATAPRSARYSLEAEEQRRREKQRRRRRKKKSPGRRPNEVKFADAHRTDEIYPPGIPRSQCPMVRRRAVWRLEDGHAVLVGYCVFSGPGGSEPRIPGVTSRCEYGLEILVVLAFLVYAIGISLDKACEVLQFFCGLLYPRKKSYQRFLDGLLALYYDAKRAASDGRLGTAGRQRRVADFEERLCVLCRPYGRDPTPERRPHERAFANLVNELLQRLVDEELFTFVLNPDVEPTNNLAERLQRDPAKDRDSGRTSKTAAGAHRRSVITSVLESLRVNLPQFTLQNALDEILRWMVEGVSRFTQQLQAIAAPAPALENTS